MADRDPSRRLIRMPGIRDLEARALLEGATKDRHTDEFALKFHETCQSLFGITEFETHFKYPDAYYVGELSEEEEIKLEEQEEEYEAQFETHKMDWEEDIVEYLHRYNWDLTDDRGQPLHLAKIICRVIEAVAKGIKGKAPDAEVIAAKDWGEQFKKDVTKFLKCSKETK